MSRDVVIIAVESRIVFQVPDDDVAAVERRLLEAHQQLIGQPVAMVTVTGQVYVPLKIERFAVERQPS